MLSIWEPQSCSILCNMTLSHPKFLLLHQTSLLLCMLSSPFSQTQHCCFEESCRWGGDFPILKCASIAWSQRSTITSQLMEFQVEHISWGASGFVFEDQPPDAFEFQFGKIVQFNFFLYSCIFLYSPFPSINSNSTSYHSFEYSLDWCKSPNFISSPGRIGIPKPHFNTIHLWYFHHTVSFFCFAPWRFFFLWISHWSKSSHS